nr:hypothetical protein [Ningiella sp. W23]
MNKIENFENILYKESKLAFTKIIQDHGSELYVIGFYFTGSYSLLPMFNTLSDLKKSLQKNITMKKMIFY